ncbi:hypothetical protein D9758_010713 [Tetrapyrgos nigripes]|uniref:BAG domain-containing protein n=1 Tax=Tetrapyrgos nigripes TaxID=182062 RepID=A0A8H5GGK9_9AGAR|nr:hypothetical protein D9758_010713 [Tetrapyrgos nigripes]
MSWLYRNPYYSNSNPPYSSDLYSGYYVHPSPYQQAQAEPVFRPPYHSPYDSSNLYYSSDPYSGYHPHPPSQIPEYDAPPERLDEAAPTFQTTPRVREAFEAIQSLQKEFASLKQFFVWPTKLDYQLGNGRVVSIPTSLETLSASEALSALESQDLDLTTIQQISKPELAHTPSNMPVREYAESLTKLILLLDGVESFREKKVIEKRKAVVRSVMDEVDRVEEFCSCKDLWVRCTALFDASPERLEEAAPTSQTILRIRYIQTFQDKLASLKQSFDWPTKLDYQLGNGRVVSIPTSLETLSASKPLSALKSQDLDLATIQRISMPKLAPTDSNTPVCEYANSLNLLLTELERVESYGEKKVREERSAAFRSVADEAARVEEFCKDLWVMWTALLQSNSATITKGASGSSRVL